MIQLLPRYCGFLSGLLAWLVLIAFHAVAVTADAPEAIRFKVSVARGLSDQPLSGRLLIFMTRNITTQSVIEPNFLDPKSVWICAVEVLDMQPGKSIEIDPDSLSFPAPFSSAPPGDYQVMALLDLNHSYTYSGMGAGDLHGPVQTVRGLTPTAASPIELTLTERVPEEAFPDTGSIKLVEMESPSLSAFWGRPIKVRAGVVLPPSYGKSMSRRFPTVFNVHGYGGSHRNAWRRGPALIKEMTDGTTPEMIYVFLNGYCPLGHHEFADSANNGPWGHALTAEFIPYLERKFRMDGVPRGRLLTGHSSGGWSTLWLQVNYPGVFGGTWSTSPDPVDFHMFTGPDLTQWPPQNFYRDRTGKPYNLMRYHGQEIMTLEEYAKLERVEGSYGGQMGSFEAVFSPRRDDGLPMPLFDRDTGRIDPFVQRSWERYDISRLLRTNWRWLGPKLRGKLHITVGTADTFHLEAAVYLLRDTLKRLGSDATFEFIEGRDHMDLYEGGLSERIAQEMYRVARPQKLRASSARR